ncbi:SDR family oxidoreductase [Endozoicomonadaceae bacterium StTr2]
MSTVLITGANRGIGLELTRQFLKAGDQVFACCRSPEQATELSAIADKNLTLLKLDVTSETDLKTIQKQLLNTPLDIVINNAGVVGPGQELGEMTYADWQRVMQTNVAGPAMLTQALLDNLRAGHEKKLMYLSSGLASIATNTSGGQLVYRASKAAVNSLVKSLSIELADEQFTVTALDPGWVKTDMGGPNATTTAEDSARGLISRIRELTPSESGCFVNYRGESREW